MLNVDDLPQEGGILNEELNVILRYPLHILINDFDLRV